MTGKENDPDTGLHYYCARWYDADLGRFISEDPVADPNNPNLYSYSGNNPLRFIDPTGLSLEETWAMQDELDAENDSFFTESELAAMGYGGSGTDTGGSEGSDSGSGDSKQNTQKGSEQQVQGVDPNKKPEGDTKNIADDIEKEKSQQIAVVIKEEAKIIEIPLGRYLKAEVKVSLDVTQKPDGDYYTITAGSNGKMWITDEDGKSVNIVRETIASIGIKVAEITQVELFNGSKITCSLSFQADEKGAIQVFSSSYYSPNNGPVTTVSLKTSDQLDQDLNAAAFVAAQVWSSVQQAATDPNTYKAAAAVAGLILAF